jgi:type I restriction-modification system DNA methylase subunit
MTVQTHSQMVNFIWSTCNLLRGPYKRNEYRKVILPLTVLRHFDCILSPTKQAVLAEFTQPKGKLENIVTAVKDILTSVPFSVKKLATSLNNTCHASMGLGQICAPRRVTYMGAWR